jgi:hypothetical protein
MSVAHRSIARLPLEIFENLSSCSFKGEAPSPEVLRATIVKQLKSVQTKKQFRTVYVIVSAVGPFLQLSHSTLLRALDPLLTFGKSKLIYRIILPALSPSYSISILGNACRELQSCPHSDLAGLQFVATYSLKPNAWSCDDALRNCAPQNQ